MKEITRQQWIAALRSGEYQQGENYMKTEEGQYCCLGVACHLAGVDLEPVLVLASENEYVDNDFYDWDRMATINFADLMSSEDADKLNNMLGIDENEAAILAQRNDNDASFEQIADYLETGKWYDEAPAEPTVSLPVTGGAPEAPKGYPGI